MKISGTVDICFSDAIPGKGTQGWGTMVNINGEEKQVNFAAVPTESHFLSIYDFKAIYFDKLNDVVGKKIIYKNLY